MPGLIRLTLMLIALVTPLRAQEVSLVAPPEMYCYGRYLQNGPDTALIQLKAYVFMPPADHPAPTGSAIVVFHGGGWSIGSAEWAFGVARRFAEKGMVGIAAQYRLSDQEYETPIDAMADARKVIRWVRMNADMLKISRDKVAAYGWSAGAHLAASAAIFADLPPHEEPGCIPDALILKSPAVDLAGDQWFCRLLGNGVDALPYSPVEHVRSGLPPTIILQGRTDTVTPLAGVQRFHDRMIAADNQCELNIYDGVGHLFTPSDEPDDGYPNPDPDVQADAWNKIDLFLVSLGFLAGERSD